MEIKNKNENSRLVFKNLSWFLIASLSLLFTGFILSESKNYYSLFLLIWCNFIGVFLVYRLNDCIDQQKDLTFNIKSFLAFPLHKFVFYHFLFIVIPISIYQLELFTFIVLGSSALIGILYSINFKIGKNSLRLKNIFFVKNFLIGIVWGNLIFVGHGYSSKIEIVALYFFVSIQVFIGGIIRDIPDLEKDKIAGVASFPVMFGIQKTILFLHVVNILALVASLIFNFNLYQIIFVFLVVLWRFANLMLLNNNILDQKWSQEANLFTCLLIFLLIFSYKNVSFILE